MITTWNLTPLFKGDYDPAIKRDLERAKRESYRFINKWKNRTDYLKDPRLAAEALKEYNAWLTTTGVDGKAGYYFSLRLAQEENNPKLKARLNQIRDQSMKISNDLEFFLNRLAKISPPIQKKFLASPQLKIYHQFLINLFKNAKYFLSEPEEKILTLKSAPAHGYWVTMVSNFISRETRLLSDENGRTKNRSFEEIMALTSSRQKPVRDQAAKAMNDILARHADAAEHELNAIFDNKKTDDALRGFSRPETFRHIGDNIESEVVETMLTAVEKRFELARRYYRLKAKALGVKKLAYSERSVPIGKLKNKYPYPAAVKLVRTVFGRLDKEFLEIFDGFLKRGQIDVYPRPSRAGGAFCAHDLITRPTYILLNHTGRLTDVLTLAHELGHGINNELIKKVQPAIYFGAPLATAEVASTFMEDFVLEALAAKTAPTEKFAIQMAKLNDEVSSIFRQVAGYRFEQALHAAFRKDGYLTKKMIGQIFRHQMEAYLGPAVRLTTDAENWWVYWSHLRNFFYVYSYASGLLISKALQNLVRQDSKNIRKIKDFLAVGHADSPRQIFQQLGIDIADRRFWDRGLTEFETRLIDAERLYRQIDKSSR